MWPSLDCVHLSACVRVVYFTMSLMCALPDLSPVKVVLFWLGIDGAAVEKFTLYHIHLSDVFNIVLP